MQAARAAHVFEVLLQSDDAVGDDAAIEFDLGFTRTAGFAQTAALTFQVRPRTHQARAFVTLARQLDLKLAFLGARAQAEDLENKPGTIDHLGADIRLQVALLHG